MATQLDSPFTSSSFFFLLERHALWMAREDCMAFKAFATAESEPALILPDGLDGWPQRTAISS